MNRDSKRCWAVATVAMFMLGLAPALFATQAAASGDRPPEPRVMRNVLVWNPGSLVSWEPLKDLDINVLHTFPNPITEDDGISRSGIRLPVLLRERIESQWAEELAQLHARGIRVWASIASTGFIPARFELHGMDPEIHFARTPEGEPASMLGGSYGREQMTSCYNNPHWIELLRESVMTFQEGGFDGVWFDVGGYADNNVYFCHCTHCREDWKQRAQEVGLPEDTVQPVRLGGKDYSKRVNREHLRWRLDLWEENFRAIRDEVKAKDPGFLFLHNQSALSTTLYFNGVKGLYDLPHLEEWGHGTAPYSLLPSYLLGKATMPGKTPVLVQNDRPRRNSIQHRIALAEAYAAGGVAQNRTIPEVNQHFYTYLNANEDLYVDQQSYANVGVLVSFWTRYLYEIAEGSSSGADRPQYWTGWMLQDLHVPYDYVLVERGLDLEELQRYRALILPNLAVLDDATLETLRAYVAGGGRVLATGASAQFDLEMQDRGREGLARIAGQAVSPGQQISVGEGRFAYVDGTPEKDYVEANPRDLNVQESLTPPAAPDSAYKAPLDWILEDVLPVRLGAKNTTTIVPQRQDNRLLLHLVNYNTYPDGSTLTPDTNVQVSVKLPEGTRVQASRAVSPDWEGFARELEVEQQDGVATARLETLESYAVLVMELEKQ